MLEISGYKILGKIGEGGMAAVLKGVQISLNRPVAIKILLKKLADNSFLLERFKRESIIIARLANPHIIHVIDRGITKEGMPFFVMEFVEGIDLQTALKNGNLDFNRKLDLMIHVAKALAYAHRNGVVHRDIKPSNILIDADGNAKVLDFGIAQFYDEQDDDGSRTRTGIVMGTIPYMSPEQQIGASAATFRSDLYSLGAMMYELFTGVKPLGRFKLPAEANPEIQKPLEDIIMACLEPESDNRPSSADEIIECLLKVLRGAHIENNQRKRASQGIANVEEKFALLDVIKEDRYGAVYLYEDKLHQNLMVIKKRSSKISGLTEGKLLTSLKHPHVVNILGASKNDRYFIIVMEYLGGGSLKDRMVKPFALHEFLPVGNQICEAMAFAHKNRIIHGNLRPTNIMFDMSGQVKITDFGLDEHYGDKNKSHNWYNMSGRPSSVQADIFAAGVIFFQMLTGTLPKWQGTHLVPLRSYVALPSSIQDLLAYMLIRKRGPADGSFDKIIQDIDVIDEDQQKTLLLKQQAEEKAREASVKTQPVKKPATASFFKALFYALLIICFCSSVFYALWDLELFVAKKEVNEVLEKIKPYYDQLYERVLTLKELILKKIQK